MDTPLEENKIDELEHIAIFGFDGSKQNSLKVHENHMIYPLGCKISIINIQTKRQEFLSGHTNTISAIGISKCGNYIASGQIGNTSSRAIVILWSWHDRSELGRYQLHRDYVAGICFTADCRHLISLGGQDDGKLIIWNIDKSAAVCGAFAKKEVTGPAKALCSLRTMSHAFMTCGEQHFRLWQIDIATNKISVSDVSLGKLRRYFTTMIINADDTILYAGTTSGDIVKIHLNFPKADETNKVDRVPVLNGCYGRHNAKKAYGKDCEKYSNGVRELLFLRKEKEILIGAGDGLVELVEERNVRIKDYPSPTWPLFKSLRRRRINGCITSLQSQDGDLIYIATGDCEIYTLDYASFQLKLQITCNSAHVYDIAFPNNFSLVFATASYQSVRVWSLKQKHELLRIVVPNFSAAAVLFSYNGLSIITAWNDGTIRAFTPLTGKLIYAIPNAHNKGCSALTISSCDQFLVSGGCEGQIRIWKIETKQQKLLAILKEHTAPIASLQFNCFDREIVSSSSDGTCILWDTTRLARRHVLSLNTQFTCAVFFPTAVQILATGTNRKISYWEVYDGSLVREVEASPKACVNCISINKSGEIFVTAGADQIVKLWDFQTAIVLCAGAAHAASIISCKFSPCGKYIVSGSADGTVIIWKVPEKYWPKANVDPLNVPAIENVKKLSKYDRRPEDIKNLSRKTLQIFECPSISPNDAPKTNDSKNSSNVKRK